MKFFTVDWRDGRLSDAEFTDAIRRCEVHVEQIARKLPAALRTFIETVSLNDAIVRRVVQSRDAVTMTVRAGDLQRGYVDIHLDYARVTAVGGEPSLERVLSGERPVIHSDEVDVISATAFEHRFLFETSGEAFIQFEEFRYSVEAVRGRDFSAEVPIFRREGT